MPARVPVLNGTGGNAARPITPTDAIDVAAPFADPPPRGTKKRKRGRQSKDQKMDSVFAASEGVRVVAKLVLAATKRLTVNWCVITATWYSSSHVTLLRPCLLDSSSREFPEDPARILKFKPKFKFQIENSTK